MKLKLFTDEIRDLKFNYAKSFYNLNWFFLNNSYFCNLVLKMNPYQLHNKVQQDNC